MIGLVVVTCNRPSYAFKCLRSIKQNLSSVIDKIVVVNDGSDKKFNAEYRRAYKPVADIAEIIELPENHGVAFAKNVGIKNLLHDPDIEWVFVIEDDITILSQDAVTGYVNACKESGMHHLSFAHHGPANTGFPDGENVVSFFPHSIGAWCVFSRECLESVGLFDENFICAWEHIEQELRLIQAGYMPNAGPHNFPDATGSIQWVAEIPDSINHSSIRPRPDWFANIKAGLEYWQREKVTTFELLFGDDMPLHDYAMGILNQ